MCGIVGFVGPAERNTPELNALAEAMAADVLSLPMSPHLSGEDQDIVVAAVLDAMAAIR